jgi:hypothetical protein
MNERVGRFGFYAIWPRGTSSTLDPSEQYTCITEGGTRCGWNSGFPNPVSRIHIKRRKTAWIYFNRPFVNAGRLPDPDRSAP